MQLALCCAYKNQLQEGKSVYGRKGWYTLTHFDGSLI